MPKLAIIGAGPAGIVSARQALKTGLDITIYEKSTDIGGVWHTILGSIWTGLRTNVSKFLFGFSDKPWPHEVHTFPKGEQIFEYLKEYAQEHGVLPHIKFGAEVLYVEKTTSGQYAMLVRDREKDFREVFDAVIVASGMFNAPKIPSKDGSFAGTIIHSKDYKDAKFFAGQKVLVVGNSFSGTEIAAELAVCANVTHLFHRPVWILPKYLEVKDLGKHIPIDLYNSNSTALLKSDCSKTDIFMKMNQSLSSLCMLQQSIEEYRVEPEDFTLPPRIAISDKYMDVVSAGRIHPHRGDITRYDSRTVHFSDGTADEFDTVIFATGYSTNLNYLSPEILRTLNYKPGDNLKPIILFNSTIHPDLENMFFLGIYPEPFFAIIEQQAKWSCGILTGKFAVPKPEEMIKQVETELFLREEARADIVPHGNYILMLENLCKYTKSMVVKKGALDGIAEAIFSVLTRGPITVAHCRASEDLDYTIKQAEELTKYLDAADDADYEYHLKLLAEDSSSPISKL